ncbi:conserved hypothetical protein [Candidatus Desulfosporosinus infrequens]|uniref:Uncharacterized protein n=1 Tax=Candidatus Desulfosporosinus infrequens TaxID=2043169 RepID=A0A2U3KCN5_9FIRM|nr:conserved hypothetical protein [Candidatus Desulfosporosinus infrequens]
MKTLIDNFLSSFSSPEEPQLSEAERLLTEIEETRIKMAYAWNHLDYAAPEYVEVAVLELLLVETQYSILNKRYCLLLGIEKESPYFGVSAIKTSSFSLKDQLQNHAYYGALFNSGAESPSSGTPRLVSQNP